jgi:two-component system cell cycle sensor histidine kinase/response regulator CckA
MSRFFDLAVDLLCIVGFDGRFKRVNPSWERILGHCADDVCGRHWTELVYADDRDATQTQGDQVFEHATSFFENRYKHRDGGYRWLSWNVTRVTEEEVFYCAARDVTGQKETEAQLRASEAYKSAILSSAMDAIISVDAEGRIAEFNPAAERMYGYRADQVRGKRLVDLIPPEDRARFLGDLPRFLAAAGGGTVATRIERTGLRADGSRFPHELTVTRAQIDPPLLTGFIRDLTDVKRAEADRRRLEEQLRHAQKMEAVGRLAGGVAHDFNNLLSVILGFTDFAAAALPVDAPGRESLDEVKKAANRAVALVRQLLAFSRRQVLTPKVVDVAGVILDLERILRGVAGEQIDLQLALEPKLWPVRADPAQLEQVLVNLAMNARDAMPEGGRLRIATANVELDAGRIPAGFEASPGAYVAVTVEDTGVGMTDEVASRAFEPFFTTKAMGTASGLGLSTVYGIVVQSGGFVRLQTTPGKGTAFEVYLPRAVEEQGADAAGGEHATGGAAGETILLVEDEEAVRLLVRKILEQRGYKVLLARHGGEALEICRRTDVIIHLLLTDAVMPVLSGPELLRRAIALRPDMKLAIMSGYSDRPAVTGVPFIAKPFTPTELDRRIREILAAPAAARR